MNEQLNGRPAPPDEQLLEDAVAAISRMGAQVATLATEVRDLATDVRLLTEAQARPVPQDDKPAPGHQLLTIDQACERLAMGRTNVYRLIKAGYLVPKRIGGRLRFSERELERFVDLKIAVPPKAKSTPTK